MKDYSLDTVDKKTRSMIMSKVGQKHTGPEIKLRKSLHRLGYRYRLHVKELPGSPDLVFPKYRAVIFVHGCFWHDHEGCKFSTKPSSRTAFWLGKFAANKNRDRRNYQALEKIGWRVLVVWECAIKTKRDSDLDKMAIKVKNWLASEGRFEEIGLI